MVFICTIFVCNNHYQNSFFLCIKQNTRMLFSFSISHHPFLSLWHTYTQTHKPTSASQSHNFWEGVHRSLKSLESTMALYFSFRPHQILQQNAWAFSSKQSQCSNAPSSLAWSLSVASKLFSLLLCLTFPATACYKKGAMLFLPKLPSDSPYHSEWGRLPQWPLRAAVIMVCASAPLQPHLLPPCLPGSPTAATLPPRPYSPSLPICQIWPCPNSQKLQITLYDKGTCKCD